MYYTDNPLADYDRYCEDQARQVEKLPKCSCCGEPITDDYCYEINDEYICEACMNDYYRKAVDSIVD